MTKTHRFLGLALCLGLAAGCGDEQKPAGAAPAPSRAPTVGTPSRIDREPAKFTDEDRGVIAYLDAWEPLRRELGAQFTTVRRQVTATRIDIARRRDSADPKGACDAIKSLLERNAAWHRDHPLPAPLTVERVFSYESNLEARHTGKGDDVKALAARVSTFHDHRDDFDRKSVRQLNQQLENLNCDQLK